MTRRPGADASIGAVDHLPHDVVEMLAWLLSALDSVERLYGNAHPGFWSPVDAHAAAHGDLPDDRHLRSHQLDSLHYMWRSVSWVRASGKNSAALVAVIHSTTGHDLHAKRGTIRDVCAWRHHVVGPLDAANCPASTFAVDGGEHPVVEQLRGLAKYPSTADAMAGQGECTCGLGDRQRQILARLAAVYRTFPGYRKEWAPS
jgi:hypothetical protein